MLINKKKNKEVSRSREEKTYLCVEEKRREKKELRREGEGEDKEREGHWCLFAEKEERRRRRIGREKIMI
jgi:hypothetical protein